MKALLAFIILLIGLLVFTYYWINNKKYFGNRPTFFKSKPRRFLLIIFFIVCAIYSAYLFQIADWGYGWIFMIIVFYVVGYFIVDEGVRHNEMIDKVFRAYHAFSLPDVLIKKEDLLPNTAGFAMDWLGYSKPTVEKAMDYINSEIAERRIKNVFDIPPAIATYFAALMNSKDPKTFDEKVTFSKARLQKIHDRVFKGIDDRSEMRKMLDNVVTFIDRNFKNFSLVSYQRPIFSQEQVELREHALYKKGKKEKPEYKIMALFPEIPGNLAYKFGWIEEREHYMLLANLEFARRNPEHYLSKEIKKKYKFSDQEIIDMADGGPIPKGTRFDF